MKLQRIGMVGIGLVALMTMGCPTPSTENKKTSDDQRKTLAAIDDLGGEATLSPTDRTIIAVTFAPGADDGGRLVTLSTGLRSDAVSSDPHPGRALSLAKHGPRA